MLLIDAPEWSATALGRWRRIRHADGDCDGSFFTVVGFPSTAYETPTDVIPHQSLFEASVGSFLDSIARVDSSEDRISLIVRLFQYMLLPAYGAYHRRYHAWRRIIHAKCDEFRADPRSTRRLRALCRAYMRFYPL